MKRIECNNSIEVEVVVLYLVRKKHMKLNINKEDYIKEIVSAAKFIGYPVIITNLGYYFFEKKEEDNEVIDFFEFLNSL